MKILFLTLFFVSPIAMAATVITPSSDNGVTYVDTLSNTARINFTSDVQNPDVAMDGGKCGTVKMVPTVVDGKTVNKPEIDPNRNCKIHTFRGCNLKKEGSNGDDMALYIESSEDGKDVWVEKPMPNCLAARKKEVLDNPEYCQDDEAPIAIFTLQQKSTCSDNKSCQKTTSPTSSTKNFPVPVEKVKECSPNDQNLVIMNDQGGPSMMASLNDNEHCGKRLEPKVIDLGKVIKPLAPVNSTDTKVKFQLRVDGNGFRIGRHTHYYFNTKQKNWCVRFCEPTDPKSPIDNVVDCNKDVPNKRETCADVLNDTTLPMAWDGKQHKTAIKLQVVDGKPVATIGSATADSTEKIVPPKLDNNQPVVKLTLGDDETSGQRTTIEVKDNNSDDSPVKSRLEISPTYTLGTLASSPDKKCDSRTCLNSDWLNTSDSLSCKKDDNKTINPASFPQEMCYSCHGLTPGRCGTQTVLTTKTGRKEKTPAGDKRSFRKFSDVYQEVKSCGGEQTTPTTTPVEI
ncbi:hypothetical protein K2X05_10175 [bacterium]|nr:hypothetical protein [bacterium]